MYSSAGPVGPTGSTGPTGPTGPQHVGSCILLQNHAFVAFCNNPVIKLES